MSITGAVKKFVREKIATKDNPVFLRLWQAAKELQYKHHSRMTYAQIEAAINRNYMDVFGRPLNWENPQTYNEKIQVSKLYMPTPEKTRLADKYAVREWIAGRIGSEYLIPLLGVYDSFDQIDFDALPDSFVIKCNHDSGSVTLVKDKSKIDRTALKSKYDRHMRMNFAWMGWEMHYRDIKPKIVIEKYIDDAAARDYSFFCFGGKPYYCAIDIYDRFTHKRYGRNFYGMKWDLQPFSLGYANYTGSVLCPDNFDELKAVAEKLAEGFPHVRVDLYSAGSKVYFGEMTFSHASGSQKFTPDEWDYKLGALWPFDTSIRSQVRARSSHP